MSTHLPAEWESQSGVLLTWPHRHSDWLPQLDAAELVYVALVIQITRFEPVVILCWDPDHRRHIQSLIHDSAAAAGNVTYRDIPTNDTWIRDYGPITVVKDGAPLLLDFTFNSWGNKYAWDKDNIAGKRLHESGLFGDTPMASVDLVLEGGGIESDGRGTLLTTSRCLLSDRRNPDLDRDGITRRLSQLLGAERVLWLNSGRLAGDDTDGHIDILARFCSPETILFTHCNVPRDEHYAELNQMQDELRALRTAGRNPYELVPLPWPQAKYDAAGRRLAATYANFLIINGAVLVPVYRDPADERALRIIEGCFPGRTIIPIDSTPLIHQGGSLHCATMQVPAGVLK